MAGEVLAEVEDLLVGHVEDDEGVGEDALALHGQSLHPRAGKPRQDEALLLLLDALDFLLHHLGHDVVLHDGVVLEVGLDFLPQFLLFGDFLLEEVAHRDGGKLVMVGDLEGELAHFEAGRTDDEYLFAWVRKGVLCGLLSLSMRKEMGSSGCLMIRFFSRSSNRSYTCSLLR